MSVSSEFAAIIQSYLDLRWHFDPVAASAHGVSSHDHRLGRFDETTVGEYVAAMSSIAAAVENLDLTELADEIDRTALLNDLRSRIHILTHEHPYRHNPSRWLEHVFEGLYVLMVQRDVDIGHRRRAAIERLDDVGAFLGAARGALDDCPAVFLDTAREIADSGVQLVDQTAALLAAPGDAGFAAAADHARAALDGFARELRGRTSGTRSFAIGEEAFAHRLRMEHALPYSAAELWTWGVELIQTAQSEVEVVAAEIAPGREWQEVVNELRQEQPPPDGLVAAYRDEMERARAFVAERNLVSIPPGPLDVIETPSFLTPIIPFAAYQPPGAFAVSRVGTFYVTVPEAPERMRDHCRGEIPGTALHEGYPGHHLQFLHAYRQERPIRRVINTPAMFEGWALYCEAMMGEEGFYRSPPERLFQKVALLWRAARVVLDVGLHTQELSIDGAVRTLRDLVVMNQDNALAEVRRYCAEPAYQLCYAAGRREIFSLRERARARDGDAFSLTRFHDDVLSYGGLPVYLAAWGLGLT